MGGGLLCKPLETRAPAYQYLPFPLPPVVQVEILNTAQAEIDAAAAAERGDLYEVVEAAQSNGGGGGGGADDGGITPPERTWLVGVVDSVARLCWCPAFGGADADGTLRIRVLYIHNNNVFLFYFLSSPRPVVV